MSNAHKVFSSLLGMVGLSAMPSFAFAQTDFGAANANQFANDAGLATGGLLDTIANIIQYGLGFLGIILVLFMLYAGFLWMTAGGNGSKIEKAKTILSNSTIGLLIIVISFALATFIFSLFGTSAGLITGSGSFGASGSNLIGGGGFGGGALGRSIARHYPDRDQQGVPRNAKILVTFYDEVALNSLSQGGKLNTNAVKIFIKKDGGADGMSPTNPIADVTVSTSDNKNFVFAPAQYLGSPSQNLEYSVVLTDEIKKKDGTPVFSGLTSSYAWSFTTSTSLDTTSPQVMGVSPTNPANCPATRASCVPRNQVIQVIFNEPVDPTLVTGSLTGLSTVIIDSKQKGKNTLKGRLSLTNNYQVLTFISDEPCGNNTVNSCGERATCLPANDDITVSLAAATIDKNLGAPVAKLPYDGVVDLAGNSFDGNKDGVGDGPTKDTYSWTFNTSAAVDLTPPIVMDVSPKVRESNVKLNENITVTFNEPLSGDSLSGAVGLQYASSKSPNSRSDWQGGYVVEFAQNQISATGSAPNDKAVELRLYNDLLPSSKSEQILFYPSVTSKIRDLAQNCYNPAVGPVQSPVSCELNATKDNWKNNTGNRYGVFPECNLTR